jgi:ABC-type lipoprotein export system ATPase subunit
MQMIESSDDAHADVTYHPVSSEVPLLSNINMELQNHSLGLVYGRSGSGKTTLLQLLSGLRQQTSGSICMIKPNGQPSLPKPHA